MSVWSTSAIRRGAKKSADQQIVLLQQLVNAQQQTNALLGQLLQLVAAQQQQPYTAQHSPEQERPIRPSPPGPWRQGG